jgi:hypothetical protein
VIISSIGRGFLKKYFLAYAKEKRKTSMIGPAGFKAKGKTGYGLLIIRLKQNAPQVTRLAWRSSSDANAERSSSQAKDLTLLPPRL